MRGSVNGPQYRRAGMRCCQGTQQIPLIRSRSLIDLMVMGRKGDSFRKEEHREGKGDEDFYS